LAAVLLAACSSARPAPVTALAGWPSSAEQARLAPRPLVALDDAGGPRLEAGWRLESAEDKLADRSLCHAPAGTMLHAVPESSVADFSASVLARSEPAEDEAFGLAFWWQGTERYHLARANTRTNSLRLYRRDGTHWSLLASRDLAIPVGQWHELAVRAENGRVRVALDGEPLLLVAVAAGERGALGLWAERGTRVCFRRLLVSGGDGRPSAGDEPG
jgi:hypothetical protein